MTSGDREGLIGKAPTPHTGDDASESDYFPAEEHIEGGTLEEDLKAPEEKTAAQAAAAFGIKIYTIGVGTEGMAPVPVGRGLFGLRYENRPVEIDDSLLTDVARMTGGRYFRATNAQALDEITHEIDRLERTAARTHTYTRYTELFRWPLGAAVLALFAELGLLAWRAPLL